METYIVLFLKVTNAAVQDFLLFKLPNLRNPILIIDTNI